MALTITPVTTGGSDVKPFNVANKDVRQFTVTFDNSYATAGESLTAADLGCKALFCVIPQGAFRNVAGTLGLIVHYDASTSKLLAYWTGGAVSTAFAEVASTTDLSAFSGRLLVIGR